jgi:hypothetical protein
MARIWTLYRWHNAGISAATCSRRSTGRREENPCRSRAVEVARKWLTESDAVPTVTGGRAREGQVKAAQCLVTAGLSFFLTTTRLPLRKATARTAGPLTPKLFPRTHAFFIAIRCRTCIRRGTAVE